MLDFDLLEKMLEDANAGSRAAECHGFLCAQVCVASMVREEVFTEYLLADANDDVRLDQCKTHISELAIDITRQIASPDFELQLMLPDDAHSLENRGIALTEWCQGFLSGLGVAGLGSTDSMSDASRELIDDLYKICRLGTDDLGKYCKDGESDLMGLIEYVRMGAILIYDEYHGKPSNMSRPEKLH